MGTLFEPRMRDSAIETTCANLLAAGILLRMEIADYMASLAHNTDTELAEILLVSRELWDNYLENRWSVS